MILKRVHNEVRRDWIRKKVGVRARDLVAGNKPLYRPFFDFSVFLKGPTLLARIAQQVEHHVANVEVAGSIPVSRSDTRR